MPDSPQPSAAATLSAADWEGALWDTIAHLQTLIRLDTVNPPGNELAAARYLDDVLRGAGVETQLGEPIAGRGALVGRIRGDASQRPLLLLAHMDVVGVERDKWSTPPFGAELREGYVYGRGAIDDKGMLAVNLEAMILVRRWMERTGRRPTRDLLFVATSDEETGGIFGIDWVMEHHPELAEAEFGLNEGGRIRVVDGRPLYCAVQCAEKVPHNIVMTARGTGGHASIPHDGNALTRLAIAIARIAGHQQPLALSDVTRTFFRDLATVWPDASLRRAMAGIASDDAARVLRGARALRRVPSFDAVLRDGISPTLVSGGTRSNVIPTEATATLNVRTLPGHRIEDLVAGLRSVVADDDVTFTVRASGREAATSPIDSPMFVAIRDAIQALDPAILTVPYLSTGATDSAALRAAGVACYGLLPFPLTQGDEDRMHGHDERVAVDGLGFGVRLVYSIIERLALATAS
jgi:acetylornithine deacetylase/succinyl-diaminopimelate desuccinylase-like protein